MVSNRQVHARSNRAQCEEPLSESSEAIWEKQQGIPPNEEMLGQETRDGNAPENSQQAFRSSVGRVELIAVIE